MTQPKSHQRRIILSHGFLFLVTPLGYKATASSKHQFVWVSLDRVVQRSRLTYDNIRIEASLLVNLSRNFSTPKSLSSQMSERAASGQMKTLKNILQ